MATITGTTASGSFTITPDLVLGWDQAWKSRHVTHEFIGGGIGTTLIPANPPAGPLKLLFSDESSATTAAGNLAAATDVPVMTIEDSPASAGVSFYVTDQIDLALDDSKMVWVVSFSFQALT